jgi:uridylate kinase
MRIMLRIGGSVIASPVNPELISKYVELLKDLRKQGHGMAVVVGGGSLAREFIDVARDLGLDERAQDEVAISVSRVFAQLFLKKLGDSGCQEVPLTVKDAVTFLLEGKIVVMGGLKPGITTDTVAALIIEQTKTDLFIKATDQEGIYDKDPKKHIDAVKLDHLNFEDLPVVFTEDKHKAGIHQILDSKAIEILKKGRVKAVILNGFKPENVLAAVKGEKVGTLIA